MGIHRESRRCSAAAGTWRVLAGKGEGGLSAVEVWKQRVAAHHVQSHKIRAAKGGTEGDRWEAISPLFRANPHRTDDGEVNRLVREVTPATTVLPCKRFYAASDLVGSLIPCRHRAKCGGAAAWQSRKKGLTFW